MWVKPATEYGLPMPRNNGGRRRHHSGPTKDAAFESLNVAELRSMRAGLSREESRVSYWRRIIQARTDLLRKASDGGHLGVAELTEVLADARVSHRRVAAMSVEPVDYLPAMADLAELWSRQVDDGDAEARGRLIEQLRIAESDLSSYRRDLHRRIDNVTTELIVRYRENPSLALIPLQERLPS